MKADASEAGSGTHEVLSRRGGTLAEDLRDELEERIVSGALLPGTRIDEIELAERFKISRTPVREALKALMATGFLEARPRYGVTVAAISIPMLLEMFETMAVLEGLCAKLAARRASQKEKAALRTVHERLVASIGVETEETFYSINWDFHELVYEASHTDFISAQTRALRKRVAAYRKYVTFQPGRVAATIIEHDRIIQAIEEGDPEAAFRAASEHVTLLGDSMADLIASLPPALLRVS
jgi:DNA-binding GntR family transcriptional regulator